MNVETFYLFIASYVIGTSLGLIAFVLYASRRRDKFYKEFRERRRFSKTFDRVNNRLKR